MKRNLKITIIVVLSLLLMFAVFGNYLAKAVFIGSSRRIE